MDSTPVEVENPFAAAREAYVADQEAASAEPVDTRFVPEGRVRPLGLAMPPDRACKKPQGGASSSGASIEGVGLSRDEIRSTLQRFLPKVGACLPDGTVGTFETQAAFTVACNGRVDHIDLHETDGLPDSVAYCIEDALRSAPFPAHDQVGGALFEMPMQFTGTD